MEKKQFIIMVNERGQNNFMVVSSHVYKNHGENYCEISSDTSEAIIFKTESDFRKVKQTFDGFDIYKLRKINLE